MSISLWGKTQYQQVMWAEQAPNMYAGENCDQHEDRWRVNTEGDKGDSSYLTDLIIDAREFPPGTKITVSVPCCPECGAPRDTGVSPGTGHVEHDSQCDCGFDWAEWTAYQYS